MSKTFRENYYDNDSCGIKKVGKSYKHKRQKVKDYLRRIDIDIIENDESLKDEIEEGLEE
jgi:hypothetical protein